MTQDQGGANQRDRVDVAGLLLRLRRLGITDHRVLGAIESIPRALFVPSYAMEDAYAERAVPIDCGQTISAPAIVGSLTAALEVGPEDRVLEIGTGSGYHSAILSRLARRVFTLERFRILVETAASRFKTLRLSNISGQLGDGLLGWPGEAPFDRILVTGSVESVPESLKSQLRLGGILLIPVGHAEGRQRLMRISREEEGFRETALSEVRMVSLIPGIAERN